ncbi:MAG: hypothetical protein KJ583_01550 [Nanoarchaeota archaeon]|nr:hypothetical protein [Nanoarchaeota archaeon]MBU1269999.1 hypothetical protein [Nanoarchaeota archaeon]MBU1603978.1 hypothetical protein [Nanoarchaeota archaeon]MBU2443689.1 hypothetical protein [Nanoarchaeota archaeon]
MKILIFSLVVLFLILVNAIVFAQPDIPPPDFLPDEYSNNTMYDNNTNDSEDNWTYEEPIDENQTYDESSFTDEPEENNFSDEQAKNTPPPDDCPNVECPSSFGGINILFLFVIIVLSGGVIFLILEKRKIEKKTEPSNNKTDDAQSQVNIQQQPSTHQEMVVSQMRNYIHACRSQGFNDYDIRNELIKHGHPKEIVDSLF